MDRLTKIALDCRPRIRPLIETILDRAVRDGLTASEVFEALDMVRSLIEVEQNRTKVAELGIDISNETK